MTKVLTVAGTRPELIRLSEVIALLDRTTDHVLVHTGQNYDYELNQVFFEDLGIRQPDHFLNVDTSSLGSVFAGVVLGIETLINEEKPDALLVLGDTNSSMCALISRRMGVPTYHMEAGNRSFDANVPEEINRKVVDHVSDFNLVYTEHARRNLLAEGVHPRTILVTGSPMREVLAAQAEGIAASSVLADLELTAGEFLLVSAHREENVDSPERLGALLDCLEAVVQEFGRPVLMSTHPRTRARLEALGRNVAGVQLHAPLGFHDYVRLQQESFCVLSDSGTIAEEAAILGFAAVTLRDAIERPEALDAGTIFMTGLDPENVIEGVNFARNRRRLPSDCPADYLVENCADRTVSFLLSTYRRYGQWTGRRAR